MPFLLALILIWFVISYQKRKNQHELDQKDNLLKQQQLIIEKQQGIERERNRIASEMHDDLGSGLTTIKYLSERAQKIIKNEESKDLISRIEANAKDLVSNMSEIIWTMNTRYDDVVNLAGFMRRYAFGFLENYGIEMKFNIDESCGHQAINGETRRDLFLVFKEILHNSAKYSGAKSIFISIQCNGYLEINIEEEQGKGFDVEEKLNSGNGLFNIQKRISNIGGKIEFNKLSHAMQFRITYTLNDEVPADTE